MVLRRVKPFADLFYGDCTAFYLLIYLAIGLGTVCCTYYLIDCKSAIWDIVTRNLDGLIQMPHFVCLLLGDFFDSASSIFRISQRNSLLLDMLQFHLPRL